MIVVDIRARFLTYMENTCPYLVIMFSCAHGIDVYFYCHVVGTLAGHFSASEIFVLILIVERIKI